MELPSFLRKAIDKIRLPLMLAALSLVNRKYLRRPGNSPGFIYQLDVRKKYGRFFPYLVTCLGATGRALRVNCLSCNIALYKTLKAQNIPFRLSFGRKLDDKTILVTDRLPGVDTNPKTDGQPGTDANPKPGGRPLHELCLSISYDYLRHSDDGFRMPFSLTPNLYGHSLDIFEELSKNEERDIRVCFIGACSHEYSLNLRGFNLPDRYTLINQVAKKFREQVVFYENYPNGQSGQDEHKGQNGHNGQREQLGKNRKVDILLAVKGDVLGEKHLAAHVKPDEYLKLLARSDFFICTPGLYYPYCHNQTEALACGTIPITCYADYVHPALRDMENCLSYKTPEELGAAVAKALALPPEEIARLRAGVRAYYNAHISPRSIAEKVLKEPRSGKLYFVNGEYTKKLMMERLAEAGSTFFTPWVEK